MDEEAKKITEELYTATADMIAETGLHNASSGLALLITTYFAARALGDDPAKPVLDALIHLLNMQFPYTLETLEKTLAETRKKDGN